MKSSHRSLSLHAIIKSAHRVWHTLNTAYIEYCFIPRSTVSDSQPVSHLLADHVVLNSLHGHNCKLTNKYTLSSCRTSLPNCHLKILLHFPSIPVSSCLWKHSWSQSPSVSLNSHDCSNPVLTILAYKCISKLARSQPPSVSPNSLDPNLRVNI
jgi:hypothetical protein